MQRTAGTYTRVARRLSNALSRKNNAMKRTLLIVFLFALVTSVRAQTPPKRTADCLDEILTKLAARGYQFVTLDKVMADPAYATKDTYITKYGPTWFFRWSQSKGLNVSFRGDPDPPKWVMELYKNKDN